MTHAGQLSPVDAGFRPPVRSWLWGGLLLLDVAKHVCLIAVGHAQPWGDSTVYWRMGEAVAAGDWWLAANPVAFRTPGYPWYLGVCRGVFGSNGLFAAVVGQHLAEVLTTIAIAGIVWTCTRSRLLAGVAWGCAILATARCLYANWLLTESLATLCLTTSVWLMLLAWNCECWKRLALAGFVLGLGVLVRPSLLAAFPALVIVGLCLAKSCTLSLRQRFTLLAVGPALCLLVLVPWCARNHRLFDRFTLCAFTGRELWTANFSPWPGGDLTIPDKEVAGELFARVDTAELNLRHQWSVSAALAESGLNDVEVDALMERISWQAIAAQPGRAFTRFLARCGTFWYCWEWEVETRTDPAPERQAGFYADQFRWSCPVLQPLVLATLRFTPERWFVTSVAWSCATWLGLAILLQHPRFRCPGIVLGLVLGVSTLLTAALEIPLYRYRCVLEPLMIVTVVMALSVCCSRAARDVAASPTQAEQPS